MRKGRNFSTFAQVKILTSNNINMKRLKVKEVLQLLKDDGWIQLKNTSGDHRQFKHPNKKGRVTVNGHKSDTLDQFLLNSIFKQAGWK